MLDQDTAHALFELADRGTPVGLVGDRHQLPAVGRGGVLDLAARYAPERRVELEGVRRFTDPAYAALSLRMRQAEDPGALFDELVRRGEIVVHASEVERQQVLAVHASRGRPRGRRHPRTGGPDQRPGPVRTITGQVTGGAGDAVVTGGVNGSGRDRVATRRNDPGIDVANRETWIVIDAQPGGGLTVAGEAGRRTLPADYVRDHVELAYATTAYGAQGSTVPTAHVLIGDHTSASSAYVGMTRGRDRNTAHLVAASLQDARRQWVEVFGRDRADLGPTHAARRAAEEIDRYGPNAPLPPVACARRTSRGAAPGACRRPSWSAANSNDATGRPWRRPDTRRGLGPAAPASGYDPVSRAVGCPSGARAWVEPGPPRRRRRRRLRQEVQVLDRGQGSGLGVFPRRPGEDVAAVGSGRVPDRGSQAWRTGSGRSSSSHTSTRNPPSSQRIIICGIPRRIRIS